MIAVLLAGAAEARVIAADHEGDRTLDGRVRWTSRILVVDDHEPFPLLTALRADELEYVGCGAPVLDDGWVVGIRPDCPFVTLIALPGRAVPPLAGGPDVVQQLSFEDGVLDLPAVPGLTSHDGQRLSLGVDPEEFRRRLQLLGRPAVAGALVVDSRFVSEWLVPDGVRAVRSPAGRGVLFLAGLLAIAGLAAWRSLEDRAILELR